MKKFEKVHRLQADSVAEIAGEFVEAAARVGRSVRFGRRKVQPGPLLNALALWFLRLPNDERVRVASGLVAELEVFLAETEEERKKAESRRARAVGSGAVPEAGMGMAGPPDASAPTQDLEAEAADREQGA